MYKLIRKLFCLNQATCTISKLVRNLKKHSGNKRSLTNIIQLVTHLWCKYSWRSKLGLGFSGEEGKWVNQLRTTMAVYYLNLWWTFYKSGPIFIFLPESQFFRFRKCDLIKANSHGAIATVIFLLATNGLCRFQCKCTHFAIVTGPTQPISRNK